MRKWFDLVRYSCGCIGFAPSVPGNKSIIIDACDKDAYSDDIGLFTRHMENKSFTPLSEREQEEYYTAIQSLVSGGNRMKEIKRLLD